MLVDDEFEFEFDDDNMNDNAVAHPAPSPGGMRGMRYVSMRTSWWPSIRREVVIEIVIMREPSKSTFCSIRLSTSSLEIGNHPRRCHWRRHEENGGCENVILLVGMVGAVGGGERRWKRRRVCDHRVRGGGIHFRYWRRAGFHVVNDDATHIVFILRDGHSSFASMYGESLFMFMRVIPLPAAAIVTPAAGG